MTHVLSMEINGFVVVALSLEVASLNNHLAVADCPDIEEGWCETKGQICAACCAIEEKTTLMLDGKCAVTLSNETEGNLIHFLNNLVADEAYSLTDVYVFERREADEYILLNVSGSCEVVIEVTQSGIDSIVLAPSASFVVLFTVVLDGIPLAGLNGIGFSEDVVYAGYDGFGVLVNLILRVLAVLEISRCQSD